MGTERGPTLPMLPVDCGKQCLRGARRMLDAFCAPCASLIPCRTARLSVARALVEDAGGRERVSSRPSSSEPYFALSALANPPRGESLSANLASARQAGDSGALWH